MQQYNVTLKMLTDTLSNPEDILPANYNRKIYQKGLDGYMLRVIVEEYINVIRVITVYKAERDRYAIQI